MKSIIAIFLFLFNSISYAQTIVVNEVTFGENIKSIHLIDTCKARNEKYFFDKKGRVEKMLYNDDESGRIIYKYNQNDNLIEETYFSGDSIFVSALYKYDGENIISFKEIIYSKLKGEEIYSYENGKLTELKQYNEGKLSQTQVYSYDNNEKTIKSLDESGEVLGYTKEFEKDGAIITEYTSLDKKYPHTITLTERKDDNGNVIESGMSDTYGNEDKSVSVYNENNTLSSKSSYSQNKLTEKMFYDGKGNIIRAKQYTTPERNYEIINTYNYKKDLIESQVFENKTLLCTIKYDIEYW